MPDPTDQHAPHVECENCGKPTHLPAACPCGCGIRVCSRCENTVRRHQAARVVAGRPDQPTHTTPGTAITEGTLEEVAEWIDHEFDMDVNSYMTRRVTVYATDPHTPDEETP